MTDFATIVQSVAEKSAPRSLYQKFHYAELEAVAALWKQKYGVSYVEYRWFQAILSECKRQDVEPFALVKRFPKTAPRSGWWPMLQYLRSHPKPLEVGEESFLAWQAKLNP